MSNQSPSQIGLSPKVPVQAIVSVLVFVVAYFGVELSPEASGAISALLGIAGGVLAPPGQVTRSR